MPDDAIDAKPTLAPKPEPTPICTIMSDRSLRLEAAGGTNLIELQSLLLSIAAALTMDVVKRAMNAERLLVSLQQRYNLDPETEAAIKQLTPQG